MRERIAEPMRRRSIRRGKRKVTSTSKLMDSLAIAPHRVRARISSIGQNIWNSSPEASDESKASPDHRNDPQTIRKTEPARPPTEGHGAVAGSAQRAAVGQPDNGDTYQQRVRKRSIKDRLKNRPEWDPPEEGPSDWAKRPPAPCRYPVRHKTVKGASCHHQRCHEIAAKRAVCASKRESARVNPTISAFSTR
ncbi:hypothetical protein LTS18_007959 [Coniosporium uncinatum]|uniref:Uncharacterized protein n=1 Tax=Coniosporium uncinatum TaxID=93489 RepID=A0ACC3D2L7_9PEZI|nr:hypothetical protein LTS18_007959 [Coniosporium uncinatum]